MKLARLRRDILRRVDRRDEDVEEAIEDIVLLMRPDVALYDRHTAGTGDLYYHYRFPRECLESKYPEIADVMKSCLIRHCPALASIVLLIESADPSADEPTRASYEQRVEAHEEIESLNEKGWSALFNEREWKVIARVVEQWDRRVRKPWTIAD